MDLPKLKEYTLVKEILTAVPESFFQGLCRDGKGRFMDIRVTGNPVKRCFLSLHSNRQRARVAQW